MLVKYILILLLILPTAFAADRDTILLVEQTIQKEVNKGNRVIIDKINQESDMCYKNVEDNANSYFGGVIKEIRTVLWINRILTFVGILLSMSFSFLFYYFIVRKFEKRREKADLVKE